MTKWTLKKKASKNVIIPNSELGITCSVFSNLSDPYTGKDLVRTIQVQLGSLQGSDKNNSYYTYNDNNEYLIDHNIDRTKLEAEIMNELKPYIEQIGNKFAEIIKSKGFIKK